MDPPRDAGTEDAAQAGQQAAVARLGLDALSEHNTGKLMDRAVALLAETLGVEFCKVLELQPGEEDLLLKAGVGWRRGLVGTERVPADMGSQAGFTLRCGRPVIVEDLRTEERFAGPALLVTHGVVSGMSAVIEGAEGRPYGVLGVHTSRRRRFTEHDVNFLQTVANLLATALDRERIEAERKRAEAALLERERLAAVGQLAAGIAHDFNNILTVVVGVAERLQRDPTIATAVREKLGLIAEQGHRGTALIRQIMDFSRRSAGTNRQPMDLAAFLQDVTKFLKGAMPEHIRLTTVVAPGDHIVRADVTQLQQIFTNLALNSRDVMPNGGEFRIALGHRVVRGDGAAPVSGMAAGDWIALTVSDTGTGMSPDVLQHVFEPFFTTKERGKGTGLGLAQVYGLVKQHDGFIEVRSAVGSGTTFTLYLPAEHQPEAAQSRAAAALALGAGQTVLLVEDEAPVRDVVAWQLETMGYSVLTASSGEDAWQIYRQHTGNIAVVLLDLVMPGMGGAGLYQAVRRSNPQIPVIVLSGYSPTEATASLARDEFVQWLQKPVPYEELARALRRSLEHAH